jgi:hypothetical protein
MRGGRRWEKFYYRLLGIFMKSSGIHLWTLAVASLSGSRRRTHVGSAIHEQLSSADDPNYAADRRTSVRSGRWYQIEELPSIHQRRQSITVAVVWGRNEHKFETECMYTNVNFRNHQWEKVLASLRYASCTGSPCRLMQNVLIWFRILHLNDWR